MEDLKTQWVVGIGASAGGLEALTQFVAGLPKESPACFIIAQHLAPHAKSMMVELLAKHCPIPIDVAVDNQELKANRLFIVPPNYDIEVVDAKLVLTKAGDETRPKPSVDRFFASLGKAYGSRAISITLSGTGSDGAEGVRAVKRAGGITIAQDEATAKYSGMPNAAQETGQVDLVLNPLAIAQRIAKIVETGSVGPEPVADDRSPDFEKVISLIRKELGNDFSQYKIPTIQRRLSKRMLSVGVDGIEDYYNLLLKDPNELRALAQDFLVSVTAFFRDTEAFARFSDSLKSIIEKKIDGEEVRVWSAGCATGEEPYSIAMVLYDHMRALGKQLSIKVFATDLDTDAISKARVGVYADRDVQNLPDGYLERFFDRRGEFLEVKKSIRDYVVFARQDLIQSPPFVKLDAICCRNVIIYFEPKLQQRIFEIFSYALKPGGLMFLGKSEAIAGAAESFEPTDKKAKLFVKKATAPRAMPPTVKLASPAPMIDVSQARRRVVSAPSATQLAQTQILERYGIAGAIVDAEGTIQQIIGNASSYLKIPSGLDAFKIHMLVPKTAGVELQLLMRRALKTKELQVSRAFKLTDKKSTRKDPVESFKIQISPFESREESSSLSPALLLITFDKVHEDHATGTHPTAVEGDLALQAAELEQELSATKEHLQTVIEELGVTNEELQSTNEELSSTNEELQSSNEELETTNEEFQSTNEELTTLNEEMNIKSGQLRIANADLENIQVSLAIPLLVVDEQMRLARFNPSSTELFDISYNDVNQPLAKLSCRCEIDSFTAKVRRVIDTGDVLEATVEGFRAVYQMRIAPRRGEDQKIIGAVILFFNNTVLIQTEQRLRKSERRVRGIIDGSSSLIFLKDMSGKYLAANRAFLEYFNFDEKNVLGKTDRDLFSDRFANQLRNGDLEAVLRRTRIEKQEDITLQGKNATFLLSRFPMYDDDSTTPYAVGTVAVDISAQVTAQDALQKSESLYRGVVEDQSVFVARFEPGGKITFVNAAFVRYFGGTASDYLGNTFANVIDTEDQKMVKDETSRLSSSKPLVQVEHRHSRYGSAPRWIRWINKAVLAANGALQEIQAVGFDVTEYRQQTDQMVQREMLFSNIFTYTTDFLTVFRVSANNELLLESFNRSVDDGAGYTYAQFLGRNVRDLVTSQHRVEILEKYKMCVELKLPQTFDEELLLQGGIRYLSTTVIPVVNNAGAVERVVTLSRDISKYKIAEADLNAAKAAAEIANETKSDFLASMSHELRSPLNVVIGMAGLLQEAELGKEEREQVNSIQRSGKVLLTLIEDILDISKIEAGKTKLEFSTFSLSELVSDVVDSFSLQAQAKGVKLVVKLPADGIDQFIGDNNRVRQILVNLFGNAIKFTDKGKVELIITSIGHKTTGRRLVRFDVKDSGIGIPEEHHSRIFKKFSQIDSGLGRRYGGTGLGLVICQRLTTLMNGQIGFTSEWNKGSTFWFELPLTIAKKARAPEPETELKAAAPKAGPISAKILAVDDSPDSRMLLGMLLKRLGHTCDLVDCGEDAIEAVQKSDYDLVLMDVQMPGMDGYETTFKIRKLNHANNAVPVLALTANAMVGDSEKCFDSGMNDYLTKPVNLDLLRNAITKWASLSTNESRARKLKVGETSDA